MTSFATPEGLRDLLIRLHDMESIGHFAWRLDAEAERLMRFTIGKYRWLATNHHCAPEDSAYAAFEAMRTPAVRYADDPWAVVTRAVQVSLIAEERANDLLCAPGQARRRHILWQHDARRFSEYETDLTEYDPIFWVPPEQDQIGDDGMPDLLPGERPPTTATEAVDRTIKLFTILGWPDNTITCALDYISSRLMEAGDPRVAYDYLRRDFAGLASLDVSRQTWATLLRLVLGSAVPDEQHTRAGRGLLKLFAVGYTVSELLTDVDLVREISTTAPRTARRPSHA